MNFITADEHINHVNILGFTKRPYNSMKGMTRDIINRNNSVVSDEDTVYHLGDFYVTNTSPNGLYFRERRLQIQDMKNILHQLKGNHILVKGNHDAFADDDYIDFGFKEVHTEPYIIKFGKYWFVMCHDPALVNMFGDHYPNHIFLCGHIHRLFRKSEYPYRLLNVGVDVNNFKPLSVENCIDEFYKEDNYESS